jgi:hypothetical protein
MAFLVYFGYPQAREDDAERAVRARWSCVAIQSSLGSGGNLINLSSTRGG